jgi:hypothetical protein
MLKTEGGMSPIEKELMHAWAVHCSKQKPLKPRLREYVWIGIVLVLVVIWATGALKAAPQVPAGREAPGNDRPMTSSPAVAAPSEVKYAALIAACFNGERLTDGVRVVKCKVEKK